MKVVLFGRTGLLGAALFDVISNEKKNWKIISPSKEECDVTDTKNVENYLNGRRPELIINATGYTSVDKAEAESEKAFLLNETAIANLAKWSGTHTVPIVHFSTDYVFDGAKKEGYDESAKPNPLSVYGKSKTAGEMALQKNTEQFFLIRTSWLFGPGGKNFVDTILDKAARHEPLKIVNDQTGNPTYTMDLAKAALSLLESQKYGIYHIVNSGSVTWYSFAQTIFELLGVPYQITPIRSNELPQAANRPLYSILKNTKLPKLRNYREALEEYLQNKQIIL